MTSDEKKEQVLQWQALHWMSKPGLGYTMIAEIEQLELLRIASGREGMDLDPEDLRNICMDIIDGRATASQIALIEIMNDATMEKMNKLMEEPIKWD